MSTPMAKVLKSFPDLLLGVLADGAGVEEDDVRHPLVLSQLVPGRAQQTLHDLRVARVHLAPVRLDEHPPVLPINRHWSGSSSSSSSFSSPSYHCLCLCQCLRPQQPAELCQPVHLRHLGQMKKNKFFPFFSIDNKSSTNIAFQSQAAWFPRHSTHQLLSLSHNGRIIANDHCAINLEC